MPTTSVARTRMRSIAMLVGAVVVALAAPLASEPLQAATPVTAGYRDHAYGDPAAPGGDDVTAARNQSKLWTHDGRWFGLLFDNRAADPTFRIYRFDMATQDWTNTDINADTRNRTHSDVVTVGNTLYIASSRAYGSSLSTGRHVRIYKYTYDTVDKRFEPVTGFPKTLAGTTAGTGYPTIAADPNGHLYVAFTQPNASGAWRVMVSKSIDAGATWATPIQLPVMGNPIQSMDVAAIAPMWEGATTGVGVLWSNQSTTDDSFYFAAHVSGDLLADWRPREAAPLSTPGTVTNTADEHISLKTAPTGELMAAVKTSRNHGSGNSTDPLIAVFRRTGAPNEGGTWSSHRVTSVATKGTRPVLVIDDAADEANVFLTYPDLAASGQQAIYRRTAPLATLDFGASSLGTPVIKSDLDLAINDVTSTKQVTTAATGIVALAANLPTLRYLHACIGGPCPKVPVANFAAGTRVGRQPLTVTFTDTSTNAPTKWAWDFGDGTTSTQRNPTHIYTKAGNFTVKLTASNVAGSDVETKTGYVYVALQRRHRGHIAP
jgi:hypothetical protein